MFSPQAGPLAQRPAGLLGPEAPAAARPPLAQLRPWALLERLLPVKLDTLAAYLRNYERTIAGLRLIEKLFPEALAGYGNLTDTGWWEVLAHLANLVEEAGWFEIDWGALNEAWAYWMEDSAEQGDHLATFLRYIPARQYGFDQQSLLQFPPLELLHVLLDGSAGAVSSELLVATELYDSLNDWTEADRQQVWDRLHQIEADPGAYPEPVRWLPELARWACRRTGNHLLDGSFDPYHDGPWLCWESEAELEQVRSAWRRAGPVIEQFRRLMAWYEAEPGRIILLTNFLLEGKNYEELDW